MLQTYSLLEWLSSNKFYIMHNQRKQCLELLFSCKSCMKREKKQRIIKMETEKGKKKSV